MRYQGKLTDWDDKKGFGFITPAAGGPRVFVHISAFPRSTRRPQVNEPVSYLATGDGKHRWRAQQALFRRNARRSTPRARNLPLALGIAFVFLTLLAVLAALGLAPPVLAGAYALLSLASFMLYRADKAAAATGRWRTAENTLHLLDLAGGWPGALVAQRAFRHKTKKRPFQAIFWCTIIANCAALAWLLHGGMASDLWPAVDGWLTFAIDLLADATSR